MTKAKTVHSHYAGYLANTHGGPHKSADQKKVDKFVTETADYLRPVVVEIEAAMAVTKNHYGRYLHILLMFEDVTTRKMVALALLEAGANPEGLAASARNAW